jgi:electron transport complex protein RnfG
MKKESTFHYILRLTVTLLLICAVVALALAGVNAITKDKIAAIKAEKTQKAIAEVLPGVTDVEEIAFTDESGLVSTVYKSDLGYAVEVTPTSGFAGAIKMMVGVSHDGKVLGVSIISHAETAGLGAVAGASNAKGQAFRDSFLGLTAPVSPNKDGGQADTITGATITSRAICDGVNAALACVANLG